MSKYEYSQIKKLIRNTVVSTFPDKPSPFFIIGVSGGADSMALLYLLKQLGVTGVVVHINYHQRGEESQKDQELVEHFAFEWGFECCSISLDDYDESKGNFQQWARLQRYQIFEELKTVNNADAIAVAHHKDDQIETILHKLFRGNAPHTWQGMQVFQNGIFRPLLAVEKKEILQFCDEKAIPYREDASNITSKYARNLIRNEVAASLTELIPGWQNNVLKLQEFGKLNDLAISELTERFTKNKSISITELIKLPLLLKSAIIQQFLVNHKQYVSSGQLQEIVNLIDAQVGSKIELSNKTLLVRDRDYFVLTNNVDGFNEVVLSRLELEKGVDFSRFKLSISDKPQAALYIDADKLKYPLTLRKWKNGDKIQPLGMKGSQKISDHLTNRKVSTINREKTLLLAGTDGTIYAIIFEANNSSDGTISDYCKVTDRTNYYLSVTKK